MLEFSQRVLSLGFRTQFFRSIPPLFWTLFYCWCLNELNSRSTLKHCIFATFGRDFELAAVTAFSKKLEKRHFLYRSTVSPQFHKNIENRGSPHNLFGGRCRGLSVNASDEDFRPNTRETQIECEQYSDRGMCIRFNCCISFLKN